MKVRRPSELEKVVLTAVQEAIESMLGTVELSDGTAVEAILIREHDNSRAQFSLQVLDRLRGQGPRNEEIPTLEFHCGPYGRTARRRK